MSLDGDQELEVTQTVRFTVYGTKAQAEVTAAKAVRQLGVLLSRDVTAGRCDIVPLEGEHR